MTHVEQVFFVVGVSTSIIGAIALTGLLAWQGLEWWVKFNDIRKPLMQLYWQQLRRTSAATRGRHGSTPKRATRCASKKKADGGRMNTSVTLNSARRKLARKHAGWDGFSMQWGKIGGVSEIIERFPRNGNP